MSKAIEIISKLYKTFGTDSGILFGIKEQAIVETIVKFTLDQLITTPSEGVEQAANEYASKIVPSSLGNAIYTTRTKVREDITNAFLAGTALASTKSCGMRWVKASERLPTEPDVYFVRYFESGEKVLSRFEYLINRSSLFTRKPNEIEWLEEL